MPSPLELEGFEVGRLKVLRRDGNAVKPNGKKGPAMWLCQCECGSYPRYRAADLKRGAVVSCGCYHKEMHTTHGKSGSKEYSIWNGIIQRCTNPKDTGYEYYGGRGIKVCDEWKKPDNFFRDMGDCPTPRHTIDRIDPNGDYCKSNCRWATQSEQMRNRRRYTNWNQKLTIEQVKEIKYGDEDAYETADRFNVSVRHVWAIRSGKHYKEI